MKRWALRLLLSVLTILLTQVGVRAQAVEFGSYRPFTVHSADGLPLKDDVLLVFHGFLSAMPNGAYKRLHAALSDDYSVIGFNYDYFDIAANDEAMGLVWDELLAGRSVTFAGTSLGGFWANRYAEEYGAERAVLINPVVSPADQLLQFVGLRYAEKRRIEIDVSADDVERYASITRPPGAGLSRLVILTRDDDILDYRLAEEVYSGPRDEVLIFQDGGHTLDLGQDRYTDAMRAFLRRSE